jgi:transcriptional regulator with XRE-family HTH domain
MITKKKTTLIPASEALAKTISKTTFGSLVRSMRESDEISQAELARNLGVSRQFLNAVEMGRSNVALDFAKRVAEALGYSVEPFAETLIQDQLRKAGIDCKIALKSKKVA